MRTRSFLKKHGITLILIVVFVVGLSALLYPSFSEFMNSRSQSRAISSYSETVAMIDPEQYREILEAAHEYNAQLLKKENRYVMSEEEIEEYYATLAVSSNKVIGYLEIPEISVKLPMYHGTGESALQVGVGHIEGTSLPIGGETTHAGVSGHRGLPSALLLTNLNKLVVGDIFKFTILNETLTYEVDQIVVTLPEDMSALEIVRGMDYATIVTCTPYGVNSHRLLVRGHRIPNIEEDEIRDARADSNAEEIGSGYVTAALVFITLAIIFVVSLIKSIRWKI